MNPIKAAQYFYNKQLRQDSLRLRLHNLGLYNLKNDLKGHRDNLREIIFNSKKRNFKSLAKSLLRLPIVIVELLILGVLFWLEFIFKSLPRFFFSLLPYSLSGWMKFIVIMGVITLVVSASSLFFYLSKEPDPKILQDYIKLHHYRTAVALRDRQGHLIGALASPNSPPDQYFSHEQRQGALYVEHVPDVFWDVLITREDRDLDFKYQNTHLMEILLGQRNSYKGINFAALFKRPIQSKLKGNNIAGGSALINLIIKNLYGVRYFNEQYSSNHLWSKLQRKKEEIKGARNLFPYLAKHNGLEFKRWIAMHAPLLSAGDDVYGIRSASATLFGKRPKELSAAEQSILAAAYHRGVRFQPLSADEREPLQQARFKRWQLLIKKAKKGVRNAYQTSQPEKMNRILADLEQMQTPQMPKVPSSLQSLLNDQTFTQRQKYGNLKQRTDLLISSLKPRISQRLKQENQKLNRLDSYHQVITDIKISLPVGKNYQFKKQLDQTFAQIMRYCPHCYSKNIGRPVNTESNGALVRIVVANSKGEIVRYYRRGYVQRRPIASISKIPIAVLLASHNVKIAQKFCNKAYQGRKNASGLYLKGVQNCNTPKKSGHSYTFKDSMAQSKNLPLFYALTELEQFSLAQLSNLYKDFGLDDSASLRGNTPTIKQLAFELAFGLAEATPEQTHRMIQTLTQQLYRPTLRDQPHVIQSLRISKYHEDSKQATVRKQYLKNPNMLYYNIAAYLNNETVKETLRKIFVSPVKESKGTLHSFNKIANVNFLLAKSGTSETPSSKTRDKSAIGSFEIHGNIYTFSIFIGTDDLEQGLGSRVTHQRLITPIMKTIVKSLL